VTRQWFIRNQATHTWGIVGDVPVPADYDGNARADIAVWRPPTGQSGSCRAGFRQLGVAGGYPVPGNFDSSASDEMAVFRPSTGQWLVRNVKTASFGLNGDLPAHVRAPLDQSRAQHTYMITIMTTMKEVTATEAKAKLLSLLDEVATGEEISITRHGKTVAKLVSARPRKRLPGELAAVASSNASDEELFSAGETWEIS
jgi:prevent-host-death family protein